jgi:type II secretory pathway pseudopilin PulG
MDLPVRKALAGALLFGTSVLSGNATLIASAGALGVNWTSEALASIWQRERLALVPGSPVQRAATRAIRRAAEMLKALYQQQAGARADLKAFELIRDCADVVGEPDSAPMGFLTSATAEAAIGKALDSLLFGHDERAVTFLKKELLGTVARIFREELAADAQAWQSFHGMLIEQLGRQFGTLSAVVERLPEVLARFAQQQNAQEALQGAAERLEALIAQLQQPHEATQAAVPGISFENEDLDIGGSLQQAGGDIRQGQGADLAPEQRAGVAATFSNKRVKVQGSAQQAAGNIIQDHAPTSGPQGSTPSQADPLSGPEGDKGPTRTK